MTADSSSNHRAVFFDRDGTLAIDVPYNRDPTKVRLYEEVPAALRRLKEAGWKILVVTNQSGIGRGRITEEEYAAVNAEFVRQCGGEGIIDGVYHAPDHPDDPTPRRKPGPEMLLEGAREHGVDLARSWMIGDKVSDVEAGLAAGTRVMGIGDPSTDIFPAGTPVYAQVTEAIAVVLEAG